MTNLATCPQCGCEIAANPDRCNVCDAVIRPAAEWPRVISPRPPVTERLADKIKVLRERLKRRRDATDPAAQEIAQGGRTPSSPDTSSAAFPVRTKAWVATTLLIAAALVLAIGFLLPRTGFDRSMQIEAILEAASSPDKAVLEIHLEGLASEHGQETVDAWMLEGARRSLAKASKAIPPLDAARDFQRAAILLESMTAPRPETIEVAADALNRAGDCHCELNDVAAARAAFRRAEAHYATILATESTSAALRDRVEEKNTLTRRIIDRGCSTP